MPANLTPQYHAAEQRFKDATTHEEKIDALAEMMAVIPKHKGTEKIRATLKQKMAKLQKEGTKKHGVSTAALLYSVERSGAGQVVLAGAANVGKSSLLASLTHATPEIGEYPYTTQLPLPGMMSYEDIQIQLVDIPPLTPEYYKPWMGNLVRQADLILLVVDLGSDDLLDQVESVLRTLEGSRIRLVGKKIPDDDADGGNAQGTIHRTILVANKQDTAAAEDNLRILNEFFASRFEILPASAETGAGLGSLRERIFQELDVIRVYTKVPGKKVDLSTPPFVLKRGSTVLDAAAAVHRGLAHTFRFAKVWSSQRAKGSVKHDGQMVERSHCLEDEDILELH